MVNLIIAGFSKCGTTTLYDMLKMHENIGIGTSKEPAYFSNIKGFDTTKNFSDWSVGGNYDRGINWYDSIFRGVKDKKYVMEASTIYSFDPKSSDFIHKYNANTKIIFIVREPYKRIESHYFQEVKNGMKLPDFKDFIVSEHPRLEFYKKATKYKGVIENYIETFGKQNVFVTSLNSLKDSSETVISDIFNFLKIENLDFDQLLKQRASNVRRTPRFRILKNILIGIERSKIAKKAPRFIQEFGSKIMRAIDGVLLKEVKSNPNVSESVRNAINSEFLEDLKYLKTHHHITL